MRLQTLRLATGAALVHQTATILVVPSSSCGQHCGNVLDSNSPADIECDQNNYGSSAAVVFRNCLNCEVTSTAYQNNPNQSDQQWLLYNSRYALSECLWGQPGNHTPPIGDSPCLTSRACLPLRDAFQYANLSTDLRIGPYDYCAVWAEDLLYEGCVSCLRASSQEYLANMIVLLHVGCTQQPAPGATVAVQGTVFSTALLNATAPTPTGRWADADAAPGALSLAAKAGVAAGGLCLVLAAAGAAVVCHGRRRRRAFLRALAMRRQQDAGAGAAIARCGGAPDDPNQTPLSQKPLRGWDDSPWSGAMSEPGSSHAICAPHTWPSQQASPVHRAAAAGAPVPIGMALAGGVSALSREAGGAGGSPALLAVSSRSSSSSSSSAGGSSAGGVGDGAGASPGFGNRVAMQGRPPVLQHPGYGRYSPERVLPPPPIHTMSGGSVDGGASRV